MGYLDPLGKDAEALTTAELLRRRRTATQRLARLRAAHLRDTSGWVAVEELKINDQKVDILAKNMVAGSRSFRISSLTATQQVQARCGIVPFCALPGLCCRTGIVPRASAFYRKGTIPKKN